MSPYMKIDWNSLFGVLFLFIYVFKVGIHQLALTLIKTSCINKNTNKNQANFLASLSVTNAPLTIPCSQYVELWAKSAKKRTR